MGVKTKIILFYLKKSKRKKKKKESSYVAMFCIILHLANVVEATMAHRLARRSVDREVWVRNLVWGIMLCSWDKYFPLTVSLLT